jgi:Ca2+-binding EF-hand superfamily protein
MGEKLANDLVGGMHKSRTARFELQARDSGAATRDFDDIVFRIAEAIKKRAMRMTGDSLNYKAFMLLTENRSPTISKAQLKTACQWRLNLSVSDEMVDAVFERLDDEKSGLVKAKLLIEEVLGSLRRSEAGKYVFEIKDTYSRALASTPRLKYSEQGKVMAHNSDARVSYDQKMTGVIAPPEELCKPGMTVEDLEKLIRDKLVDRTHTNIYHAAKKDFGDMKSSANERTEITLDQLRFTILKRFQLMIPESLLVKFFAKHDKRNRGFISLPQLVEGVVTAHAVNEPIIDEHPVVASNPYRVGKHKSEDAPPEQPTELLKFLAFLRHQIRKLTNREGRAPTMLLAGCNRMSVEQSCEYLQKRLRVKVEPVFMRKLQSTYNNQGLLDMRRLMRDAMSIQDGGLLGVDQSLVHGGIVTVDTVPASLQGKRCNPQQVEQMLLDKLHERMTNDHPLSNLHKVFLAAGDTRTVDKKGLRQVFVTYDIILHEEDLDAFVAKHDRGDGKIDIREFCTRLMSQSTKHKNALLPKDKRELDLQFHFAKAITGVTGHRRAIQGLTGPSGTMFEGDVVEKVFGAYENAGEVKKESAVSAAIAAATAPRPSTASASVPHPFHQTYDASNSSSMGTMTDFSDSAEFYGSLQRPSTAPDKSAMLQRNQQRPTTGGHTSKTAAAAAQRSSMAADPSLLTFRISGGNAPSPSRPTTAPPTHARILSPSQVRSPKSRFVYTGQPRSDGISCYEGLLRKRHKASLHRLTTQQQEYGSFVHELNRILKFQTKMQLKFRDEMRKERESARRSRSRSPRG